METLEMSESASKKSSREIRVKGLCALMRESEQLASLLDSKTLIVHYFVLGKTHRGVLKVFHELKK